MNEREKRIIAENAIDIATAPRDGSTITVMHRAEPLEAYWNRAVQGWVAIGDQDLHVLHGIKTWWPYIVG